MKTNSAIIKSILLLDDNQESLTMYSQLLKKRIRAPVICTRYPTAALKLAAKHFFDIILIDVTMNYNGSQFGGLEVYKNLMSRYGDSSLVVYSQFITDDLLKQYEYEFNFIEKGENPIKFIEEVLELMCLLRKRQSCFVAMPFGKEYDDIFEVIKESVVSTSYRCIRTDQQHFTKSIIDKIFAEIDHSKLIIFLSTDQNPNAFYECGYAIALNKEVITLTDVYESLPFDIRHRNAIAYGRDLRDLKRALNEKLINLTHIQPQ
jgi:CheY-like chemotaxis protein